MKKHKQILPVMAEQCRDRLFNQIFKQLDYPLWLRLSYRLPGTCTDKPGRLLFYNLFDENSHEEA